MAANSNLALILEHLISSSIVWNEFNFHPNTNQQHLIAKQANQRAKYYHLPEYDHRVHVFKLRVKVDQGLMVSNVLLKLLVTRVHVLWQHRVFFAHFVLYVAQFRESVSEYAKLAGQMDGHDAENVVEAKVTDPYVIQSYYLSKEKKMKISSLRNGVLMLYNVFSRKISKTEDNSF